MGAIFSIFNRFSMIQLRVDKACDGCRICNDNCPMDLDVALESDSGDCIRCLECTQCGHVKLITPFSSEDKCDEKINQFAK